MKRQHAEREERFANCSSDKFISTIYKELKKLKSKKQCG
jgi:hypothetical protein